MPNAKNAQAARTRALLVSCAVDLIALNGPNGVTLRDVGRAAGQKNNSVVQYHFGHGTQLVTALLDTHLADVLESWRAPAAPHRAIGRLLVDRGWAALVVTHPAWPADLAQRWAARVALASIAADVPVLIVEAAVEAALQASNGGDLR